MREFELQLDDAVQKGLRKHHRNPRNSQGAVECHNVRVGESGLEPYATLTNPFTGLTNSWPFPQIIDAKGFSFLIDRNTVEMEDRIYTFVPGSWSPSQIFAVDEATFDLGDRFQIADFEDYVLLTNGVVMLRYDTQLGAFIPFVSSSTIPLMRSVCAFKGQAVGGGVLSSWHGRGLNSVIWTRIGVMDFTPGRDNEAGFRNADSEVYRTRRLGDHVMVYGSKSVGRLTGVRDPAPTFAWKELSEFGLCGANAIDGGLHQHVFVAEDGWVWSVSGEGELKKLGYQEFMKQMDLSEVAVVHDRVRNDFFISDGVKSFLLAVGGLSSIHQCVSGWVPYGENSYGVFVDTGDISFRWISDTFDMGYRSSKTINVMEVGGEGAHVMRAGAQWRIRRQQKFQQGTMAPVNDQGVAYPIISGTEFRAVLEASHYEGIEVDYVKMRWKMTDLRSIRGVYAAPPRGQ